MSSRQLRKLQKQRELEQIQTPESQSPDESEEDEGPSPAPAPKARPNLFAALGGEGEDENHEEDDEEDDEGGAAVQQDTTPDPEPQSSAKKNKKKKKKKKSKAPAAEDAGRPDDDEIDKAMRELNIAPRGGAGSSSVADDKLRRAVATNSILQINPYHLKAINEMRNLFGREVIESADAEEEQQQQQQQPGRRGNRRRQIPRQVDLETFLREQPGAKKLPEVSLRRNIFIQGKDYWPAQSAGGLTMKEVRRDEEGGAWTEYAYVHDGEYDAMQTFFFACVQMGDPMRMVHLLKRVPYHVSTLLQVSFVAKQDQNMSLSAELCERALFAFGRVTTSAFRQNVEQGKARLDFRRPENRQFWLAGYHYLRSLLRKGTFRTALEWAKLLYVLDPKDPYAMRHYIHFLAIRAYESKWLLEFLADVEQSGDKHPDFVYVQQSRVLARLQTGDVETAKKELAEGIQTVPWLYCALFQELGLDAPPSIWGINAESDSRAFWVKLYTTFTKDLWNNTQATSVLLQVAKAMGKVYVSELPADDAPPDLGAARLAYLEGQTSLITLAPRALLDRQPNYEFDPMPPAEEDNIFTHEGTQLPWKDRHGESSEALMRMRNALAMQQAAGGGGVAAGAAGAAAGAMPQGFAAQQGFAADDDSEGDYASDEELRRDLEEHARRANEPGFLGNLMNMLGMGGRTQHEEEGEEFVEEGEGQVDEEDDGVPGAWPDHGRG